ncbi:MAG: hypothetical protein ACT4NU_09205 [Chromatiales bacterium]
MVPQIDIEYWPEGRPGEAKLSASESLTEAEDYTAHVGIGGLEPGRTYEYRVRLNGIAQAASTPLRFHTQPLWQWRTDPPAFTVALGSCAYINDTPYCGWATTYICAKPTTTAPGE